LAEQGRFLLCVDSGVARVRGKSPPVPRHLQARPFWLEEAFSGPKMRL